MRKHNRLAALAPPREIVEADREERADDEKSGHERGHVLIRVLERHVDCRAHQREAHAVEEARPGVRERVGQPGLQPAKGRCERD